MCCLKGDTLSNVTIDPNKLTSEINDHDTRIIDVRSKNDYLQHHIPNSVNLPLSEVLSNDSPNHLLKLIQSFGIDDTTHVVVYDNTFGALASRLTWSLSYIGHDNVSLLDVTYDKWQSLGYETNSKIVDFEIKKHKLNINNSILSTINYLEQKINDNKTVIVDNRERLNFLEHHIPSAINIPYKIFASQNKILKNPKELKQIFENRNIKEQDEIITYCGSSGTLSGLAYNALKLIGFKNTKLYVRSFKEWRQQNKKVEKQNNANYWDLSAE